VKVQEVHTEKIVSTGGQNQTWIDSFSHPNFENHTGIHDHRVKNLSEARLAESFFPHVSDQKTGDRIKSVYKDRCIEDPPS
jgi:hypothetical protein